MKNKYEIRPFYPMGNNGFQESQPTGWDVWEISETSESIIVPCESKEEAKVELDELNSR